ncbi:reverse transcriptase domain-containing protein [Methylobacter sp.]|uniref:reverse transcriptase domain-containing protein n=1 Tax=Methylobacter sp. TaxID=2051955 RepID=UPI0012008417|nr:reverse transcriptase domain-containing protein [Methylobacter sp.]TAK61889.1 MAG: reverse transcriptase [Methylobacter sp.]
MLQGSTHLVTVSLDELEQAYRWVCRQRRHFPPNADIWGLRRIWPARRSALLTAIKSGDYRFSSLYCVCKKNRHSVHVWSSEDAVVIKVLTELLRAKLPIARACTYVKGHGGLKRSVADIQAKLGDYRYVGKTDVKGYYESIDQYTLLNLIADHVPNKLLRRYCYQIVRRSVEYGGVYRDVEQGISRGCALSSLLGALYLKALDDNLSGRPDVYYLRYMDDILILTQTRWQLRRAVKALNQTFNRLNLKRHPDKTYIGKIDKGFDFLGYRFSRQPLQLAAVTVNKHVEKLHRLYEQQANKKASSEELAWVLGQYVQRWLRWCTAGLSGIRLELSDDVRSPNQRSLGP